MAEFTWTADIPAGVIKLHAISEKIVDAAIQECVFPQFATPVEGFGKKAGETFTWTRSSSISEQTSIVLSETERVPEYPMAITTRGATVQEIGASVPYTNLAEQLSFFDLRNTIQRRLKDNLKLGLDSLAAAAFKDTLVRYAVTGLAANNITTNGVFGAASTANMNTFHLEEIGDYLYQTLFCPFYENDEYVGILNMTGIRGIMRDPDWEEWHKYTNPEMKYNGEEGTWDRIRLMRTNHANALTKVGTGSVLGEGVFFGFDSVHLAEAMTPELVAGIPQDLGRDKNVGFLGILRFRSVWGDSANAGEANIVYVGST